MKHFHRGCAILLLLALLAALPGCARQGEESTAPAEESAAPSEETAAPGKIEPKGTVYYTFFDTVSYVYDYAGDSAERFDDRSAEVSHILKEYHELFDIYHEYEGKNNLASLNRMAGQGPVALDARLIDLLSLGKARGVAWELNTAYFRAYPDFFRIYFHLGREIGVCFHVGTDAHTLENVDPAPMKAYLRALLS